MYIEEWIFKKFYRVLFVPTDTEQRIHPNSIHKPPAQPVRIEKVLPLPGENRSLI
jgi:hypothetical protein